MDVVLPVSSEIITPNTRISVLKTKYIETSMRINVYKHYYVGKPDIIWLLEAN